MTIIYQPQEVLRLSELLGGPAVGAGFSVATDFIAGTNKPWEFYLGVLFGNAAAATGIPFAATTLYAIGDAVATYIFRSPAGGSVRVFLNGIAQGDILTFAATSVWELVTTQLVPGIINRIDYVNVPDGGPQGDGATPWMALSAIEVVGGTALEGPPGMNTLVYRLQDGEQSTVLASVPVYLPTGLTLAQVQTYSDAVAAEIDAVTGSRIVESAITFNLALPTGLKGEAEDGILNERGGLITFETSGPRNDSFRIPGIKFTIMPGDTFSLTNAAVAALVARLTTSTTAANIRPVTAYNYTYTAARKGIKSFRK